MSMSSAGSRRSSSFTVWHAPARTRRIGIHYPRIRRLNRSTIYTIIGKRPIGMSRVLDERAFDLIKTISDCAHLLVDIEAPSVTATSDFSRPFSAMLIRLEAGACARGTGLRLITLPVVKCHSAHRQSGISPYCYPSCERVFTTLSGTCQHAEYFLSVVEPHVEAHFLLPLSVY
ncbi:hypothetical protein CIHG_06940 [Coccidioides immitis H538.4]|uniref:Uncharacterized protein n=3 Tax=Coccidioides immitis TaxID=5501 RepID=A0A0J8TX22_COCIT|nr:hypothetical protein CIRG_09985 [Coccidioides immitis RMSCC 2394]KMU78527.1 hypothetical protein CISG_07187 [Coccidioides immitis RMSCC 3703]KMU89269.1 hypothetical protein CIHG_06940 [Coccidioides immitis H538.4]